MTQPDGCPTCGQPVNVTMLNVVSRIRRRQEELDAELQAAVQRAREEGCTWELIGHALGVSKQAAHERFRASEEPAIAGGSEIGCQEGE